MQKEKNMIFEANKLIWQQMSDVFFQTNSDKYCVPKSYYFLNLKLSICISSVIKSEHAPWDEPDL